METLKSIQNIIVAALMFVAIIFTGLMFGCKSLTVFDIKNQPQSCNDMYTVLDFQLKSGKVNDALIEKWSTMCITDRGKQREKDCLLWIYQGKELDKKNYRLYLYYKACIK